MAGARIARVNRVDGSGVVWTFTRQTAPSDGPQYSGSHMNETPQDATDPFLPIVVLTCAVVVDAAMTYLLSVRSAHWIPCALIALGAAVLGVAYRKNATALWTIIFTSMTAEVLIGFNG